METNRYVKKEVANWIGYLGAINISVVQIPQIIKTFREKDSSGLSSAMIILNILGGLLWLIYGILLNLPPIYGANTFFITANTTLLIMKYKYKDKKFDRYFPKEIISPDEASTLQS